MKKERVFLVGFMGAGKSTVGRLLATRLGCDFIDLDEEIEESEARSIRELFESEGEEYFRNLEMMALTSLRERSGCVVALGGGAFVNQSNRETIHELGVSVFLDCPLKIIMARCSLDTTRPLFKSREHIKELYDFRLPFYHKSDLCINVENLTPEEISNSIFIKITNL